MMNQKQTGLANELASTFGPTVNRTQMMGVAKKYGINHAFLTTNKLGRGLYDISEFMCAEDRKSCTPIAVEKTDAELLDSMKRRFRTLERMAAGVVSGRVRSMIVSGPAGIGKTHTIENLLETAQEEETIQYQKISGFVKATGIFKALYNNRHENSVILIDDADSVFDNDVTLNILKTALDSSRRRTITWGSEKVFVDGEGDEIPNTFEYQGSIIFITNLNFETMIAQGRSLAPHFQALISRSFYIDLNLDSTREYILRIEDVLRNTDMAYVAGLDSKNIEYLIDYIKLNQKMLRELSLRMVLKLSKILSFSDSISDFEDVASVTCLRRK